MTYTADKVTPPPSADELRARIPGWGADLDPADRPSYPKEVYSPGTTGAHWDFPERQLDDGSRERSIEHKFLTPVFGTAQPLSGLSGVIRRFAYARFSEGRAAHWLLLIAGDRVNVVEARVASLAALHPDEPISESGVLGEVRARPVASRIGRGRSDLKHQWIDPIMLVAPWVLGAWAVVKIARRLVPGR